MKNMNRLILLLALTLGALSCQKADSEQPWGNAVIYMPQANYNPFLVPNSGTTSQTNKNYSFDKQAGKVRIFLGVYRAGLQTLDAYSVKVTPGTPSITGTTTLPVGKYELPSSVSCPSGKRDVTFYLTVDLAFLKSNPDTDYSLSVNISDPSRYELNPELATTRVRINTSALLAKENE